MSNGKKQTRANFRSAVFTRDGHKCKCCPKTNDLDAHHIIDRNEMPNGGYVKENGITLCPGCHRDAEVWHESNKTASADGFHPLDLFGLIGSSLTEAIAASKRLSS